jgi:hypothetical protein
MKRAETVVVSTSTKTEGGLRSAEEWAASAKDPTPMLQLIARRLGSESVVDEAFVQGYYQIKCLFEGRGAWSKEPAWTWYVNKNTVSSMKLSALSPLVKSVGGRRVVSLLDLRLHGPDNSEGEHWIALWGCVFKFVSTPNAGYNAYAQMLLIPAHSGLDRTRYFASVVDPTPTTNGFSDLQSAHVAHIAMFFQQYYAFVGELEGDDKTSPLWKPDSAEPQE